MTSAACIFLVLSLSLFSDLFTSTLLIHFNMPFCGSIEVQSLVFFLFLAAVQVAASEDNCSAPCLTSDDELFFAPLNRSDNYSLVAYQEKQMGWALGPYVVMAREFILSIASLNIGVYDITRDAIRRWFGIVILLILFCKTCKRAGSYI